MILSITEREDKPLKYPHMFRAAAVIVVNKIDLVPHLDFSLQAAQHGRSGAWINTALTGAKCHEGRI